MFHVSTSLFFNKEENFMHTQYTRPLWQRWLSVITTLVMILGMLPLAALQSARAAALPFSMERLAEPELLAQSRALNPQLDGYTLDVNVAPVPEAGEVTKEPDQDTYATGEVVTLTATASAGWSFAGWSGYEDWPATHIINIDGNQAVVTIADENKELTATFYPNLDVYVVGDGNVTADPDTKAPGHTAPPVRYEYAYNQVVTLTATPAAGWQFASWSGDVTGDLTPTQTTITMDAYKAVTATFNLPVDVAPEAGIVITHTEETEPVVIIEVPAGAVTETLQLIYTPMNAPSENPPQGFIFAGRAFNLSAYRNGIYVTGFTFESPVSVTLYYSDEDVEDLDVRTLTLQKWNETAGEWIDALCPGYSYDRSTPNKLVVPICCLSQFGLFATPFLPPVAEEGTFKVPESVPGRRSSVLNVVFSDPNDDPINIVAVGAPLIGAAAPTLNDQAIVYTPTQQTLLHPIPYTDHFTYTVRSAESMLQATAWVTVHVLPVTDLAVAQTVHGTMGGLEFVLVGRNLGPHPANGAVISDTFPASLSDIAWTCVSAGGAVCPHAEGNGDIEETLATFPANGVVTYTVSAIILSNVSENNTVTITPPEDVFDLEMDNNSATRVTLYRLILPLVFRDYTP